MKRTPFDKTFTSDLVTLFPTRVLTCSTRTEKHLTRSHQKISLDIFQQPVPGPLSFPPFFVIRPL